MLLLLFGGKRTLQDLGEKMESDTVLSGQGPVSTISRICPN